MGRSGNEETRSDEEPDASHLPSFLAESLSNARLSAAGLESTSLPPVPHVGDRSFLDDRSARWFFAGEPVRPEDSVSDAIARFTPAKVSAAQWSRIGPVVRSSVEKAEPTCVYGARALLTTVTQLALWADTLGQPIEPSELFMPDVLDRFAQEGCSHLAPGTRLNYRRHLRAVGAAVLGPEHYPPRPLPLYRPDPLRPYTAREVTALTAWCRGLPTDRFRDNASGVVAIGFGAGLTSQEMCRLVGTDVAVDCDAVVVNLIGRTARSVPVIDRWAEAVHARSLEVGSRPFLFPERTKVSRHQLPNFLERCPSGDAPELNTLRLRISWMVSHLSAGTHLSVIAEAAGVAAAQVAKYLPFAERLDSDEARRQLRQARQ